MVPRDVRYLLKLAYAAWLVFQAASWALASWKGKGKGLSGIIQSFRALRPRSSAKSILPRKISPASWRQSETRRGFVHTVALLQ